MKIIVVAVAMLAGSAFTAMADTYQYIITPGYDPAAASLVKTSAAVSSPAGFATGALSEPGSPVALEARFRTCLETVFLSRLNSFKVIGFFLIFH